MKVWRDYRVTIPAKIRRELGLYPGTEVDFIVRGDTIEIVKVESRAASQKEREIKEKRLDRLR